MLVGQALCELQRLGRGGVEQQLGQLLLRGDALLRQPSAVGDHDVVGDVGVRRVAPPQRERVAQGLDCGFVLAALPGPRCLGDLLGEGLLVDPAGR